MTEKQIFEKYPELYREKDLPASETTMCWGLEVPEEWLEVIDKLSGVLDDLPTYDYKISDESYGRAIPKCIAQQVKIKFGELRFYYRIDEEDMPEDLTDGERDTFLTKTRGYINGAISMASSQCREIYELNNNI